MRRKGVFMKRRDLFDLNGDGKTSGFERAFGGFMMNEMFGSDDSDDDDDDDDDLFGDDDDDDDDDDDF